MNNVCARALRAVAAIAVTATGVLWVAGPAAAAPSPSPTGATTRSSAPTSGKKPALATFGIASASARKVGKRLVVGVDKRNALNFSADPGAATTDHVAVVNNSATALTLDLYAADGVNSSDGKVEYLPRATPGNGARRWVTLDSQPTIRVPARSTKIIGVQIKVPANATPGDHLVGIVVSLPGKAQTRSGQKVNFDQGVGLPTAFHISGTLTPTLRVEGLAASYSGTLNPFGEGSSTVTYTVRNVGNVTLGAVQRVQVSGLFGSAGPPRALALVPPLLPGNSVRESVRVDGVLPTVRVTAKVTLTPQAVAGEVVPVVAPVSASTGLWAVPWTLLVLVVLVVAVVVGAIRYRRAHPSKESKHSARRRNALVAGKA